MAEVNLPMSAMHQLAAEAWDEAKRRAGSVDATHLWTPHSDNLPQQDAYECEADELFYGGQAGGGKLQPLWSPVVTPFGARAIGDLQIGDLISNPAGTTSFVVAIHPQGELDIYEVEFADGTIVLAGLDHLWAAWRASHHELRKRKLPYRVVTTRILRDWLEDDESVLIPVPAPVNFTKSYRSDMRKIPPYALGILLGDGHLPASRITTADPEIAEWIDAKFQNRKGDNAAADYLLPGITDELDRLGIRHLRSWEKFIPDSYLNAPTKMRWSLLQGLMDSDGTVSAGRGRVSFSTTSPLLAKDMRLLVLSLGGSVMTDDRQTFYTHNEERKAGRPSFRLRIKFPDNKMAFRLERKKTLAQPSQSVYRKVVDIRKVGTDEAVCISIDHPNGLYMTDDFIVTHNSDLLLGLAVEQHRRSAIFRREFWQTRELIERSKEIIGQAGRFNENLHLWRALPGDRRIEFGGLKRETDWEAWKGRPHDFYGFDEGTEILEIQYRMITAWLRTTIPGQRVRVVLTGNPPTSEEGVWVINYWAPWLDKDHPNPAAPGELRYFIRRDDKDVEVDGPDPVEVTDDEGRTEMVTPRSRTFIPASLEDNVYLKDTEYRTVLINLPEPLRSQLLYGDFTITQVDDPFQVIPSEWVEAAFDRWDENPTPETGLTALGADPNRGGRDKFVIYKRFSEWFAPAVLYERDKVDTGQKGAAVVIKELGGRDVPVNIDPIGVGASPLDFLTENGVDVHPVNFAEAAYESTGERMTDKSGKYKLVNVRTASYWKFREALDPDHGDDLKIPRDSELKQELAAHRWRLTAQGIRVDPKQDVKDKIGRSPDKSDALVLAHWIQAAVGSWEDVDDLGKVEDFESRWA